MRSKNTALVSIVVAMFSLSSCGVTTKPLKAYDNSGRRQAEVLRELDRAQLTNVDIEDKPVGNAMVDLLLKYPQEADRRLVPEFRIARADSTEGNEKLSRKELEILKRPVSLKATRISMARGIDEVCASAGFKWSLGFDRSGNTVLVIQPKIKNG